MDIAECNVLDYFYNPLCQRQILLTLFCVFVISNIFLCLIVLADNVYTEKVNFPRKLVTQMAPLVVVVQQAHKPGIMENK